MRDTKVTLNLQKEIELDAAIDHMYLPTTNNKQPPQVPPLVNKLSSQLEIEVTRIVNNEPPRPLKNPTLIGGGNSHRIK